MSGWFRGLAEHHPSNRTGLAFYDANVLSLVSSGRLPNFIRTICASGIQPVVSDVVIKEVNAGAPSGEMELIKENNFLYLLAHESVFLDGKVNFQSDFANIEPNEAAEAFEVFLAEFLRSVSGSPSAVDTSDALKSAISSLSSEPVLGTADEDDPLLRKCFDDLISKLLATTSEFEPVPAPLISKEERKLARAEPIHYSELKPPHVIDKLFNSIIDPDKVQMTNAFRTIDESDDIKERVSAACAALIILGFQRDSSLSNSNAERSMASARSQLRDISHISNAAVCDVFITADKRCGKLAHAIYEVFGLKTKILLVRPQNDQAPFCILGPDCWP